MAVRVPPEHYGILIDGIKRWNLSIKGYKVLGALKEEVKSSMCQHDFWVNQWPHFSTVVETPSRSSMLYLGNVWSYVTNNRDDLRSMLSNLDVIPWQKYKDAVVIAGVQTDHVDMVTDVATTEQGFSKRPEMGILCHVMQVTAEDLRIYNLPDGYEMDTIRPDEADFVNSSWKFNFSGESLEYIQLLLSNMANTAVRVDGKPVAYCLIQYYGSMGMLYVDPDHRRKGLAQAVVSHLAQHMLQLGEPAFCYVESYNETSINLHTKCGFKIVEDSEIQWLDFVPKSSKVHSKPKCCV